MVLLMHHTMSPDLFQPIRDWHNPTHATDTAHAEAFPCNAFVERKDTHTHTLSATTNSLGLKKFSSLSASHKIDRRTAPHPTGWPISCHAIGLSSLRKSLKTSRALRETSANGPATNFMVQDDRLTHNSIRRDCFTREV